MTIKKPKGDRTKQIMDAALDLAEKQGYQCVTRDGIAAAAGLSAGHVSGLFGTMAQLRRRLMRAAIQENRYLIIAQGLAVKDKVCGKLDAAVVQLAADSLKG